MSRTAGKTSKEVSEREDGHMHDLALLDELGCSAVIVVEPESLGLGWSKYLY